jgi:hypothetical protein
VFYKIEQLENELRKYKAQMANAKGAAASSIKKRAMAVSSLSLIRSLS